MSKPRRKLPKLEGVPALAEQIGDLYLTDDERERVLDAVDHYWPSNDETVTFNRLEMVAFVTKIVEVVGAKGRAKARKPRKAAGLTRPNRRRSVRKFLDAVLDRWPLLQAEALKGMVELVNEQGLNDWEVDVSDILDDDGRLRTDGVAEIEGQKVPFKNLKQKWYLARRAKKKGKELGG
jgi:hypothetical protein